LSNRLSKLIILISGRGSNMEAIIQNVENGCLKSLCRIMEVVSNKKEAAGLLLAEKHKIPTCVIHSRKRKRSEFDQLLRTHLKELDPDLIVLAGYMKILPAEIIREFPGRIINIHPADTALHQGLHGYDWAFDNKLSSTKVTVHYVDEGLDTGRVIGKQEVDLTDVETLEEVEKRGLTVEHKFYSECIKKILTTEGT